VKKILYLCLFCACTARAQNSFTLSDSAFISIITIAPGDELYSTFGHIALRVNDPAKAFDRCYNYGTFDFDQPNFYLNFCRGKLLYTLDAETYRGMERSYLRDRRNMREQVLNLNREEKQHLFDLLMQNLKPENKNYKYDFFYDNCSTRVRELLKNALYYQMSFDSSRIQQGATMRDLLKPYLKGKDWTRFGIDLILGLPADRRALAEDFMFLPDGLHDMASTTRLPDGRSLVKNERYVPEFAFQQLSIDAGILGNPLVVTCIFALLGFLSMSNPRTERVFDGIFWFTLGAAGLVMTLLWLATDHSATKNNLNVFWALPTHLLFFWRNKRTTLVENYFTMSAILAALVLLFWKWMPQAMPVAAIPLAILVVIKGLWRRYWKKGLS
jgi:hypothetical protein